jgi:putative transposase
LKKKISNAELRDLIESVQAEFSFYGYRRVHENLEQKQGLTINEKRIRRIMKKYGLKALIWRGFKVKTTDPNHNYGYAKNRLAGLLVVRKNQAWVTDITYIRIKSGFVYLAAVMDLFSRKIVGFAISEKIDTWLCLEALRVAVLNENPAAGLIHHSDRGVQYACEEYRQELEKQGMIPSMSAKGYCYDNAFMESFFKTLKAEEVYLTEYETMRDVLSSIPVFIQEMYNKKRMHSSLGYYSPVEYEELASKNLLKKRGIRSFVQVGP